MRMFSKVIRDCRRARGFRGTQHFKLKIFQLNAEDTPSFLYNRVSSARLPTAGNP